MAPNGSISSIDLNLIEELQDKEFRDAFFEELSRQETADQIRELRVLRGKTQGELADLCDMQQPAISRLEKPDYGKWNYQTLVRLAVALDARVRFQIIPAERAVKEFEEPERRESSSVVNGRTQALEYAEQRIAHPDAEQRIAHPGRDIRSEIEKASRQQLAEKKESKKEWPIPHRREPVGAY